MKEKRRLRIASFLRQELAEILMELKDPRIGFTSVTRVDATDDLKEAKVFVSILGSESDQRTTLRGLEAARPHIQSLLGSRVHFRNLPVLEFLLDEDIRKAMEMDALIQKARAADEQSEAERTDRDEEEPEA